MDHATVVRMCESGANLLRVKRGSFQVERFAPTQCRQIAPAQEFEHDIMTSYAIEIDSGAMPEPADDVGMAHAIERNCFVLKVLNQGALEIEVLISLQENIQRLDHDFPKLLVRGAP